MITIFLVLVSLTGTILAEEIEWRDQSLKKSYSFMLPQNWTLKVANFNGVFLENSAYPESFLGIVQVQGPSDMDSWKNDVYEQAKADGSNPSKPLKRTIGGVPGFQLELFTKGKKCVACNLYDGEKNFAIMLVTPPELYPRLKNDYELIARTFRPTK